MNNIELKQKVNSEANRLIREKKYVSPVELLMGLKVLSEEDYKKWRFGKVPYLEKVCSLNLKKLSLIMKELRSYAIKNNLKPSWTGYNQWGTKGKKIRLCFSKSANSKIEKAYATHYIISKKEKK